tara:strand:+ start:906 stop:1628 length:723 start_codon:yes stop_codon:yes gene_type:complete
MKNKLFYIFFLLSLFLFLARPAFAQEVSTLFTTPEEREYLDFLRQQFLIENQEDDFNIDEVVPAIPVIVDDNEDTTPSINYYTLGGIIRQNNTRTVWLNELSINESNLPANMRLVMADSSLLLRIQTELGSFDLKSGQTLDVENGQILESWQFPALGMNNEAAQNNSGNTTQIQPANTLPENSAVAASLADTSSPDVNSENLTITADEIGSLIGNDDPIAVTELLQILQIQEALSDESIQ